MINSAPAVGQFDDKHFQEELRRIVDKHMSAQRFLELVEKLGALELEAADNVATLDNHSRLELASGVIFTSALAAEPADCDKLSEAVKIIRTVIEDLERE